MRTVQICGEHDAIKVAIEERKARLDYQVLAQREEIERLNIVWDRIILENIPF